MEDSQDKDTTADAVDASGVAMVEQPAGPEEDPVQAEDLAPVEASASAEEPAVEGSAVEELAADEPDTEEPEADRPAADEPAASADPASAATDTALPQIELGPKSRRVPWWPFLTYLVAWIGVVAASILTLSSGASALPAIQQEPYPYLILAGLVLALLGPILAMTVWLIVWLRAEKDEREGLLTASLVKGAGVTLLGVLMWWGTLVAVDALRLGMVG